MLLTKSLVSGQGLNWYHSVTALEEFALLMPVLAEPSRGLRFLLAISVQPVLYLQPYFVNSVG